MAYKVNYIALREIDATHTLNTAYDLTMVLDVFDETNLFKRDVPTSMDGTDETLYHRNDKTFSVNAAFITKANLAFFKEFIFSVQIGETFTFYDDVVSYTCKLQSGNYSPKRTNTDDNEFAISMTFKVIN